MDNDAGGKYTQGFRAGASVEMSSGLRQLKPKQAEAKGMAGSVDPRL